ncbi:MAG: hypothetical protein M5U14_12700 [Acidimicrobiia bacterium]|nr:hypothetical protein [Acidimicrobiia bacterium]
MIATWCPSGTVSGSKRHGTPMLIRGTSGHRPALAASYRSSSHQLDSELTTTIGMVNTGASRK